MTSASRTNTRLTSGRSRPSLSRLTPTTALISPTCKFCKTWALSVAFRSEWMYEQRTPPSSCRYVVISSASRLLTVRMMVFSFLSSCDASWRSTSSRTPSFLECTEITGSRQKVGRMTISGTSTGRPASLAAFELHTFSRACGVADRKTVWETLPQNSSLVSGLFSIADGSLKPCFTSFSFLALSPKYIAEICGMVMWDSSKTTRRSSSNQSKRV